MKELLDDIQKWTSEGTPFAIATVVRAWKSAPRGPGASMAVTADGEVVGSISGGCVEGAVYEAALAALAEGTATLEHYGVSDDDAFAVGLTCGGEIDVLVQPVGAALFDQFAAVAQAIRDGVSVAIATPIAGGRADAHLVVWPDRTIGSIRADGDEQIIEATRAALASGAIHVVGTEADDADGIFIQSFLPPPHMIVFGAIDHAAAVCTIGKFLGYQVSLVDARPVFATAKRFPTADEVIVEWPHKYLQRIEVDARTALCVLTHDPKFDIPLLTLALRSAAGYIGVMGSRRTHADRVAMLRAEGLGDSELDRMHAPIGLDIGALTPEEVAVSVAAELIQSRSASATGASLSTTDRPIHA